MTKYFKFIYLFLPLALLFFSSHAAFGAYQCPTSGSCWANTAFDACQAECSVLSDFCVSSSCTPGGSGGGWQCPGGNLGCYADQNTCSTECVNLFGLDCTQSSCTPTVPPPSPPPSGGGGTTGGAGGLVPCSGPDCDLCDLFQVIYNVNSFLIGIGMAITTGVFVWGGVRMMSSGGSQTAFDKGKANFRAGLIGLVIVLLAWIIIGTIINVLTNTSGPWWTRPNC